MADTYELIVLGGGTGGYSCALRAASLGLSVALVEKDKLGGTCLHAGCIPTKAFLQAAEVAEHARRSEDFGVLATYEGLEIDTLLRYKQDIVDANYKGLQSALSQRGVDVVGGAGRVLDTRTVEVTTDEGTRSLTASRGLVLATGSVPRSAPVEGAEIDGERVITSDHALVMDWMPEQPIVLGAGAVGVEFATLWQAFGGDVTIVEVADGLVPAEDADTRKTLAREFKKQGLTSLTSARATKVEHGDGGLRVSVEGPQGSQQLEGDALLVATGRRPVTEDMGFEDAGVKLDGGYVTTDRYCRTGADGVYAVGDILAPPALGLAHASFQEGFCVAEQVGGQRPNPIDNAGIPRVTYSHPEIGSVGYTEQQLTDAGIAYDHTTFPFSHNGRAMMMRAGGHAKVLAGKDGGKVLGIHIIGPKATELVAEAQLIYNWEALPTEVAEFIHPHPTLTEALGEAHLALAGKPLHG